MAANNRRFAEFMKDLREVNRLSLQQAALKLGIGIQQLQSWESGDTLPSELSCQRVAQVYRISESEWLDILRSEEALRKKCLKD
jgi:transcriptional regulator with XRE-family HTH domain